MSNLFNDISNYVSEINFTNRPVHVNYKFRVVYQVSKLILILGIASSKSGSSILKLQVLSDALEDEQLFECIVNLINNDMNGFVQSWRYNPMLSKVVNYSNAEDLTVYSNSGKLILTEKGMGFFKDIMCDESLLCYEKQQLARINKKLSESKLQTILDKGSI